jgi:DNA-binding transcriptional MerR regulator
VPTVNSTGKGRNVYYSTNDLLVLALMAHLLSLGLSFEFCQKALEALKRVKPELFEFEVLSGQSVGKNFLIVPTLPEERSFTEFIPFEERLLTIEEFDMGKVVDALYRGGVITSVFFQDIYSRLEQRLEDV